ncbi:MAG: 6-phosphogluconolactonase [Actinomycetota bacterium]|nr:6-phosphogluconolactonase [Actinomycetota bacterium]
MTPDPEIVVERSAGVLAARTAHRTVAALAAAVESRGVAHLVITGGGILESVLAALATCTLSWDRVHVWWGDERWVPSASADRNDLPALAKLFDKVDIDPAKLHRMPASDAEFPDAESAAAAYAAELAAYAINGESVPRFDVVLLGIGPDGHCASLFPDQAGPRVLDRAVIAVHNSPKPPPDRLSLTFPSLNAANEIWFVASGDGKADAVAAALSGDADGVHVPSAGPRGRDHTLWLLDPEAAATLSTPID